jgi:NitT/TauT family transport system substrate-binding protein
MHRSFRAILLGLVAALIVAGCGSDGGGGNAAGQGQSGGAAPSQDNPVTIKVAETAGFPAAFLNWGQQQGFFSKHGLNLQIDTSAGGATIIPGVVSGTYQIAGSNGASVLVAASRNLPIRVIAPGTFGTTEVGKDFAAVLVRPDSGITDAAGLAGKTVAVNTLKNIAEVTVKASLQAKGVDFSSVKFAEMGFPEMLPALEKGEIDAAFLIEPFVSIGLKGGNKAVLWPYVESRPGLEIGTFISSQKYIDANPKVVEAFQAGLKDTVAAINSQPDSFRAELPTLAKMDPEVAKTVVFPAYKPDVDVESLSFVAERLKEYGIVQQAPDATKLVLTATAG